MKDTSAIKSAFAATSDVSYKTKNLHSIIFYVIIKTGKHYTQGRNFKDKLTGNIREHKREIDKETCLPTGR